MIAGLLTRLGLVFRQTPQPVRVTSSNRRRSARFSLACAFVVFAAATVALAAALEAEKPEWRDPEFALRLARLARWQHEAPSRPLVVAFGSSRTQMGLSHAAMGFPTEPGSPIVYNFGYRAGRPLGAFLQFTRMLDSGVKPAAVLVQLANYELAANKVGEQQYMVWAPRFSLADIDRLEPYCRDRSPLELAWAKHRLSAWATYRGAIRSDLIPNWQTATERAGFVWEVADEYGFTPHAESSITAESAAKSHKQLRKSHEQSLTQPGTTELAERVFRDLVERCRREGIAVAFFWAPESPSYRSWYTPEVRAHVAALQKRLETEHGVAVFPGPEHFADTDFADGVHLLRPSAERYSRWLADTHLKPWLRQSGVAGDR